MLPLRPKPRALHERVEIEMAEHFFAGVMATLVGIFTAGLVISLIMIATWSPGKDEARCMIEHQVPACEERWVPKERV